MSAVDELFSDLRERGQKAFMPFVTAGDPDLPFTAEVIQTLGRAGAHLCEVGVPYSDPIADGPVIQASYTRALEKGVTVDGIFRTISELPSETTLPLVTMVSYAIIYRRGMESFITSAKAAGFSGAIVPDLPLEEADRLAAICSSHDFSLVQLVTPATPRDRAKRIAATSSGFIYYVSVVGITGERNELPAELVENVAWLKEQTPLPICIGFGINSPHQAKELAKVADGIIIGSAIVRRVAQAAETSREEVLEQLAQYTKSVVEAIC